jgi:protein gp37
MKTTIEWTHRSLPDGTVIPGYTFNPWWGCCKIATGCKNCYAEGFAKRVGKKIWGPASTTPRWTFGEKHWQEPVKWNREAQRIRHRASVFCASMADVFEEHPQLPPEREKLWELMSKTPWLNWLLLTKRPENILSMAPWQQQWPDNVWLGTSVAEQKNADENIDHLLNVPAVVRFVSYEPAIEQVNFAPWLSQLDWLICGGESGPTARPFDVDWARSAREQCQSASTRFFFKQVGGRYHNSGGRLLDGRTWDELPPEAPEQVEALPLFGAMDGVPHHGQITMRRMP